MTLGPAFGGDEVVAEEVAFISFVIIANQLLQVLTMLLLETAGCDNKDFDGGITGGLGGLDRFGFGAERLLSFGLGESERDLDSPALDGSVMASFDCCLDLDLACASDSLRLA